MQRPAPFSRARAFLSAVVALMGANSHLPMAVAASQLGGYRSRGKGEGCAGNKRAKSSFKQNKRRGL